MTADEFNACSALIRDWFQGDFDADRKESYRIALGDLPGEQVLVALKKMLAQGKVFQPKPGEIIAAIEHDPGLPSWPEAERLIFCSPSDLRRQGERHPCLAAFVERQGGIDRLRLLPVDDERDGKWERKRLREQWAEHVEQWQDRKHHNLALGRGDGRPKRLDPIASLGIAPVAELASGDEERGREAA